MRNLASCDVVRAYDTSKSATLMKAQVPPKLKVYQYAKCSTCVKALKFLATRKCDAEILDITVTPPSLSEIEQMIALYGGEFKKLFNTSGLQYRELKIGEKLPGLNASQAAKLLAGNGRLIKRPFLLVGERGLVGFKEEEWKMQFP